MGSIPRLERSPGVRNGNPLQYSCLENSWTEEPGGLWGHRVKHWTRLSTHIHYTITMQILIKIKLDGVFVSE